MINPIALAPTVAQKTAESLLSKVQEVGLRVMRYVGLHGVGPTSINLDDLPSDDEDARRVHPPYAPPRITDGPSIQFSDYDFYDRDRPPAGTPVLVEKAVSAHPSKPSVDSSVQTEDSFLRESIPLLPLDLVEIARGTLDTWRESSRCSSYRLRTTPPTSYRPTECGTTVRVPLPDSPEALDPDDTLGKQYTLLEQAARHLEGDQSSVDPDNSTESSEPPAPPPQKPLLKKKETVARNTQTSANAHIARMQAARKAREGTTLHGKKNMSYEQNSKRNGRK